MNKKLFLGMFAAAGMLLATSCSNDELDAVQSGNEAQVTFNLGTEGGIATRAISDGLSAKKLVYAVYKLDANGNPVLQNVVGSNNDGQFVDTKAFDNGLTETVSVTLAKGQTYQVAFWAQNPSCTAYTTTDLTNVTVNYKSATNNNDVRDAFFKTVEFTVQGNQTIDVELKRPFAQINVGVYQKDWNAAVASGIEIEKSSVVIKNAATSINLLTGEVGDETTDVEVSYVSNAIPNEELKVDLNGDKDFDDENEAYKWLSMSYILVADRNADTDNSGVLGDERATLESLQYTFTPKSGNEISFGNGLNSVPVQRNWRTNILGQILTGDIEFNITINPIFEGDINVDAPVSVVVSNADDFQTALADPNVGEIILGGDMTSDGGWVFGAAATTYAVRSASTTISGRDVVIDGNGGTITFTKATNGRLIDVTKETNGMSLTLKNITLVNNVGWVERGVNYNTNGTLTLENVTIEHAEGCSMNYAVNLPGVSDNATVVIKNSNIGATAQALNIWGENIKADVTDSHLYVIDNNADEGYAVISLCNDGATSAEGTVVTVTGGSLKVTGTNTNGSLAVQNGTLTGKVEVSETTEVVGDIKEVVAVVYYEGYDEFYSMYSLEDAINTAVESNAAGIRLIRDVKCDKVLEISKNMLIYGNGKTFTTSANRAFRLTTSDINVSISDLNIVSTATMVYPQDVRGISLDGGLKNIGLTLNNCSIDFTDSSTCDWTYAVNVSGTDGENYTLNINGGTYVGANVINIYGGSKHTINIDGATLNSNYKPNTMYSGVCVKLDNNTSKNKATIKNTTFNSTNNNAMSIEDVGSGNTVAEENNKDNTVISKE